MKTFKRNAKNEWVKQCGDGGLAKNVCCDLGRKKKTGNAKKCTEGKGKEDANIKIGTFCSAFCGNTFCNIAGNGCVKTGTGKCNSDC